MLNSLYTLYINKLTGVFFSRVNTQKCIIGENENRRTYHDRNKTYIFSFKMYTIETIKNSVDI